MKRPRESGCFYKGPIDGDFNWTEKSHSSLALQQFLASVGEDPGPMDGKWQTLTSMAFQRYLMRQGYDIGSDGADGQLRDGSLGLAMKAMQRWLSSKGFELGPIDGSWGAVTASALQRFLQGKKDGYVKEENLCRPIQMSAPAKKIKTEAKSKVLWEFKPSIAEDNARMGTFTFAEIEGAGLHWEFTASGHACDGQKVYLCVTYGDGNIMTGLVSGRKQDIKDCVKSGESSGAVAGNVLLGIFTFGIANACISPPPGKPISCSFDEIDSFATSSKSGNKKYKATGNNCRTFSEEMFRVCQ